ncbi:MAG TPA: tagaturonate reductase [Puia sp.]|nr:tagaturonate reductase [Puia sp.]
MQLSRKILGDIHPVKMDIPHADIFDLPEKVLQFGTGVLLRGLPDFFIDKANTRKIFNGRIVVVKSTDSSGPDLFRKQDGLYTHISKGYEAGSYTEERSINTSFSRVIVAKENWDQVLACAENPEMQIVISNTTEEGLVLVKENIFTSPPLSFPAKLLSFLYTRYTFFDHDPTRGMVIIPTELIPDNAGKLKDILIDLSIFNNLEESFLAWLVNANYFCSSLVDRIVPGGLKENNKKEIAEELGYSDDLLIMSESYRFWAIESDNEKVRNIISFSTADEGVVVVPDIRSYSRLKLHLLNGSHTFCCGLAYMAGLRTVHEFMEEPAFSGFVQNLLFQEIIPSLVSDEISVEQAEAFALKTLDRFRNPFIVHHWLSICSNYSTKMKLRNVQTMLSHMRRFHTPPPLMALGFAGYLLFMRPVETDGTNYYGREIGRKYPINDMSSSYFHELWQTCDIDNLLLKVLKNETLWGTDLSSPHGFADEVKKSLYMLLKKGVTKTIDTINIKNTNQLYENCYQGKSV